MVARMKAQIRIGVEGRLGMEVGSYHRAAPTESQVKMTSQQDVFLCDICRAEMQDIHCKLICPRCGYTRDCSDP
ncbi:MAG: hypothetical protein FVQ86_03380 [candidate division NC10 bacterium]|nr:hypothetical protein [candidate division NC10 bacterium]